MKKITAHVVSHSHWDREWYLGYEYQHMMLIDLIDDILEIIESDEDFKSFHLDGQTILLEDYLQVRPENIDRLKKAIQNGNIKIGPWYVLQDAFLTSSEANIRNMQIGQKVARQFGDVTKIGYFPDTFGIYAQAPQILKLSNIDNMFFGRGVKTTGFANEVVDDFSSNYSEMLIQAPNKDEVMGILFANWYCNAMEIPVEPQLAKTFWEEQIPKAQKYAATSHLLFMNGCDHQPLQKNITQAITTANELYDDIEFIHSSLEEYVEAIQEELSNEQLSTITGELRSQNTNGKNTLVNTLSSRVNQKIENFECQNLLEKVIEPLYVMTNTEYPHQKIDYVWKKLMQNHPHDSICGCSIDSVHKSMDARFIDVKEMSKYLINEVRDAIVVDKAHSNNRKIVLINTLPVEKEFHKVKITWDKRYFSEFDKPVFAKEHIDNVAVKNVSLSEGEIQIGKISTTFDFDLPKDRFRQPYYAKTIEAEVHLKLKPYEIKIIEVFEDVNIVDATNIVGCSIENEYYVIDFLDNNININNSACNIRLIDEGDVGNEYMFGETSNNDYAIKESKLLSNIKTDMYSEIKMAYTYSIPKEAEEFKDKKMGLQKHYSMDIKRSSDYVDIDVVVETRLYKNSKNIEFKYKIDNKAKDHRMRLFFDCSMKNPNVMVDSCFEVLNRNISTSKDWEYKYNDQPLQKFIHLKDAGKNLIVGTKGLHEYEYRNGLYITLFRSVSQLGDWGYFETPDAQCLYEMEFSFTISLYVEDEIRTYKEFSNLYVDIVQFDLFSNTLEPSILEVELPKEVNITSLHNNENNIFVRGFNLLNSEVDIASFENYDILYNSLGTIDKLNSSQIVTKKL